ncbi:MAG: diguanylate cyclase [Candidatus Nanopelagicales bacterium]
MATSEHPYVVASSDERPTTPAAVPQAIIEAHRTAAVGAAVFDALGTLLWANPALENLAQMTPEELVGSRLPELVSHRDRAEVERALADLGNEHVTVARLHGPQPGTWLHVSLSALTQHDGTGPAVLAQVVDITESVQAQHSLEVMSRNVLDVVALVDEAGIITWASPSIAVALDWQPESLIGRELVTLVAQDDVVGYADALASSEPDLDPIARTIRLRARSGAYRYMSVTARSVPDNGTGPHTAVAMRDVTEELRVKRELARSVEQFRVAMLGAPEGMAVTDSQDRIVQVNPALCELLGTSGTSLIGHRFREFIPADERESVDRWRERLLRGNSSIERSQHRLVSATNGVWVDHSVGIMRDELGNPALFVHQFADRTAARRLEADLAYRASHDLQTGLANKESLRTRLTQRLGLSSESEETVGVLFCDIDNLKPINDSYGHLIGDAVISAVANRLERAVRRQDEVARYGGDEFFIVLDHCASAEELAVVARNVQSAASHPVETPAVTVEVSISVGAVLAEGTADTDQALRRADEALYRAKRRGGNQICVEGLDEC